MRVIFIERTSSGINYNSLYYIDYIDKYVFIIDHENIYKIDLRVNDTSFNYKKIIKDGISNLNNENQRKLIKMIYITSLKEGKYSGK